MPRAVTILLTLATSIGESEVAGVPSISTPEARARRVAPSRRTVTDATALERASVWNAVVVSGIAESTTTLSVGDVGGEVLLAGSGGGVVVGATVAAAVVVVVVVGAEEVVEVVDGEVEVGVVVEIGDRSPEVVVGLGTNTGVVVAVVVGDSLFRLSSCSLSTAHAPINIVSDSAIASRWVRLERPIRTGSS